LGCLSLGLVSTSNANAAEASDEHSRLNQLERSASDYSIALAAERREDHGRAVMAYRAALANDPDFVEAMVGLARALVARGDYKSARDWLDRAELAHPSYPKIEATRGFVSLREGRFSAALESLIRAREHDPNNPEILSNLGALMLRRGSLVDAVATLKEASRLDPNSEQASFNLALAFDRLEEHEEAVYYYQRFLSLSTSEHQLHVPVQERITRLRAPPPVAAPKGDQEGPS